MIWGDVVCSKLSSKKSINLQLKNNRYFVSILLECTFVNLNPFPAFKTSIFHFTCKLLQAQKQLNERRTNLHIPLLSFPRFWLAILKTCKILGNTCQRLGFISNPYSWQTVNSWQIKPRCRDVRLLVKTSADLKEEDAVVQRMVWRL